MNSLRWIYFLPLAMLASCASEEDMPSTVPDGTEMGEVRLNLSIPGMPNSQTRDAGDAPALGTGQLANTITCYVYNQAFGPTSEPVKILPLDVEDINDRRGGSISLLLPKGQKFDVVMLATYENPLDPTASPFQYSVTGRTLSVDYSKCYTDSKADRMDCFFGVATDVTADTEFEESIELVRPFAQINVGNTLSDYESYCTALANANSDDTVSGYQVTIDGVYDTMSLMTGAVTGEAQSVTFAVSQRPQDSDCNTYPLDGFDWFTCAYVLVRTRKLVDLTLTLLHTVSDPKEITIPNIAVERNFQTNVFSKQLFTEYSYDAETRSI